MRETLFLLAAATVLLLGGCQTRDERIAAQNARDDQKCLGYGARAGSDAYVTCRSQLDAARTQAEAVEDAAVAIRSRPQPVPASDAPIIQPMPIPGPRCTSRGC